MYVSGYLLYDMMVVVVMHDNELRAAFVPFFCNSEDAINVHRCGMHICMRESRVHSLIISELNLAAK